MRVHYLILAISFVSMFCQGQQTLDIIIINVKDDRLELAKAIRLIDGANPKLICINVDLTDCDEVKRFSTSHLENNDISSEIIPSEPEKELYRELTSARAVLMPSKLLSVGSKENDEVLGCDILYPENMPTGYVNLIYDDKTLSKVEKFQVSNTYKKETTKYHFAVKVAFKMNEKATSSFINSHPNILPIEFNRMRKFKTFNMNQFYDNKELVKILKDKIIILGTDRPEDYFLLQNNEKMTSSEIFANIAYQIIL